jgi:two-component system OmpR family sensor kinase
MLRTATRRIAVQSALLLAVVVTLAVAGAAVVFDRAQHAEIDRTVRDSVRSADDVTDPPPGVVLVELRPDGVQVSPGAPTDLAALGGNAPTGLGSASISGRHYSTYAETHDGARFVAAYDLASHHRAEERLLWTSVGAGLLGVALAAGAGLLIGRRAVRPLATAMSMQRRFVTDASHELRTPLTVLHTRAQLLHRRLAGQVPADQLSELDQLVEDSSALGEVVSDLLLSAQLQGEDVSGEPVDLGSLATTVVNSLALLAAESGVQLSAELDPEPCVVEGAPAALRRALVALVDHAISPTGPGGSVVVQVSGRSGAAGTAGPDVGSDVGSDLVKVSVIDDGEGLDPAGASQLTERFARGTSAPGRSRRFGLGLALVDEVVRAHGGTLQIDGAPGKGARFSLLLPRS